MQTSHQATHCSVEYWLLVDRADYLTSCCRNEAFSPWRYYRVLLKRAKGPPRRDRRAADRSGPWALALTDPSRHPCTSQHHRRPACAGTAPGSGPCHGMAPKSSQIVCPAGQARPLICHDRPPNVAPRRERIGRQTGSTEQVMSLQCDGSNNVCTKQLGTVSLICLCRRAIPSFL